MSDQAAGPGFTVNMEQCEFQDSSVKAPFMLPMPVAGGSLLPSIRATTLTAAVLRNQRIAVVGITSADIGQGLHIGMTAYELRTTAAAFLRAADELDNGKGKQ